MSDPHELRPVVDPLSALSEEHLRCVDRGTNVRHVSAEALLPPASRWKETDPRRTRDLGWQVQWSEAAEPFYEPLRRDGAVEIGGVRQSCRAQRHDFKGRTRPDPKSRTPGLNTYHRSVVESHEAFQVLKESKAFDIRREPNSAHADSR
jgi:hypothetical protein